MNGWIYWSAYHADAHKAVIPPAAISALLPLFPDNAHSAAMIRHSMDIVKAAVQHLNPGQTPVLAADQPVYTHGEGQVVIIFGGDGHTEVAWRLAGRQWLDERPDKADIASSGTANSFMHASHVTKTWHAHQVRAGSLYILIQQAYNEDCTSDDADADVMKPDSPSYQEWCTQRETSSVHFDYWLNTLSLELLFLWYIRSLREANFDLYV